MSAVARQVARGLPEFVEPMLARAGRPFDSSDYLFEIKWDGTRALCFADAGGVRLMNRRRRDLGRRYPELVACLAALPRGTVLDGEVVVIGPDGKPDYHAFQRREQCRNPHDIARLSTSHPASYVVFDQLYAAYKPYLDQRLDARRRRAAATVRRCASASVIMSDGVVGAGKAYFEAVVAQGLEGVVAKRLSSTYAPGKRTDAWVKIKRQEDVVCVVIGFVPEGRDDFASLVLAATDDDGNARYVGRVGSGFDADLRATLNAFLWSHLAGGGPVVPCGDRGARWVEPTLYCVVRCMERTAGGMLRGPVFRGLCDAD